MANIQLVCDVLTNSIDDLVDGMEIVENRGDKIPENWWDEYGTLQCLRSGLINQGARIQRGYTNEHE